jgi:hypothetical protein
VLKVENHLILSKTVWFFQKLLGFIKNHSVLCSPHHRFLSTFLSTESNCKVVESGTTHEELNLQWRPDSSMQGFNAEHQKAVHRISFSDSGHRFKSMFKSISLILSFMNQVSSPRSSPASNAFQVR